MITVLFIRTDRLACINIHVIIIIIIIIIIAKKNRQYKNNQSEQNRYFAYLVKRTYQTKFNFKIILFAKIFLILFCFVAEVNKMSFR